MDITFTEPNLLTQNSSRAVLDNMSEVIGDIGSVLANIGAYQSRLNTIASNLFSMRENTLAAESRIRDADIAEESSQLVRQQLLQQAGAAILAQANQQPSLALQLLGGGR